MLRLKPGNLARALLIALAAACVFMPTLASAAPLRADLVVLDVVWTPESPLAGQNVTFKAQVKNAGPGNAGKFHVRFVLDGETLGEVKVNGLVASAMMNVTSPSWKATAGNHTIAAIADVYNKVKETNETNNVRSETFAVGGRSFGDSGDAFLGRLARVSSRGEE